MVRKIPTQVPAMVSRLIQAKQLRAPPVWYPAVLSNPPPVLPPRQTTLRSRPNAKGFNDLPPTETHTEHYHNTKFLRTPKLRPAPIVYPADRIRRQFFADFPFEALRPVSLVESDNVSRASEVQGKEWVALSQRGAYPTVEDTIEFTLNLAETQGLPLSAAYAQATDEFVALRANHELATLAAAAEARSYGATFKRDDWTRSFDLEQRNLDERWAGDAGANKAATGPRWRKPKMWTAEIKPEAIPSGEFTAGRAYVQRWQLPPAVASTVAAEGDLVSAIGGPAPTEEVDDVELLSTILGSTPSAQ